MFISNADLQTVLNDRQLADVILLSEANRRQSEQYATEEVRSYLNFQYDTDAIFGFEVFDYDVNQLYLAEQIAVSDGGIYTAIINAPAGTALTDTTYFEAIDGRNPIIVMIVVDLLAYHLFSRTGTNRIPQHIIDRYEQAIKKLKEIRAKKMNPYLPIKQLAEGEAQDPNTISNRMSILSKPKRNNFYD